MKTLNYPQKYLKQNVNLIIGNNIPNTTSIVSQTIEKFIENNPDFSNLLPLNQPTKQRRFDLQITFTAQLNLILLLVDAHPSLSFEEEFFIENFGKEYGEDPPYVIFETQKKFREGFGIMDVSRPWGRRDDYLEEFTPCGSCGSTIIEGDNNITSCMNCGVGIHGDGDCGPWINTNDYDTACCVPCYESETGDDYGGYNLMNVPAKFYIPGLFDAEIKKVLTFIQESFNS